MASVGKLKFKTLTEAEAGHNEVGGVLLVEDDGTYTLCLDCVYERPCECRNRKWTDSLAPSWSEAAPENAVRDPRGMPVQGQLI